MLWGPQPLHDARAGVSRAGMGCAANEPHCPPLWLCWKKRWRMISQEISFVPAWGWGPGSPLGSHLLLWPPVRAAARLTSPLLPPSPTCPPAPASSPACPPNPGGQDISVSL